MGAQQVTAPECVPPVVAFVLGVEAGGILTLMALLMRRLFLR